MTRLPAINIRLRKVADALATDQVLTAPQAMRHYGVGEDALLARFPHRDVLFRPLTTSTRESLSTFIALKADLVRWEPGWALAHAAGTAELRHLLGASPEDWSREEGYGDHRPDALWRRPDGAVVAVEYDAGYPPAMVRRKVKAFGTYDALVWGTPSRARTTHLQLRHAQAGRSFVTLDITAIVEASTRPASAGAARGSQGRVGKPG